MKSSLSSKAERLKFGKYVGAGNDFILVDNRDLKFPKDNGALISHLCLRQLSVGADGLILLEPSELADFRMRVFNLDGQETEMCGNGLRCFMRFLFDLGYRRPRYRIQTYDRLLMVEHRGESVAVDMGEVTQVRWDEELELEDRCMRAHHLNTGVPHLVIFCEDLSSVDLSYWGPRLRHHPSLRPAGANVSFAQVSPVSSNVVELRTYERGVEGETLACGTGACAAALAAAREYGLCSPVTIQVKSGDLLTVEWSGSPEDAEELTLVGPAVRVFEGELPHWKVFKESFSEEEKKLPCDAEVLGVSCRIC